MRIAVMGAGGVGGYLGGLLARDGHDVTLIARGPHLDALRQDGLEIKSTWGSFSVRVDATNDLHEVGQVELVLFTVKTYQNAVAIPALQPLVGENTGVLTLQNGVESGDELAQVLGSSHVLPGAGNIGAWIEAPGVVCQTGPRVSVVFGEVDGQETSRARHVLEDFSKAEITTELSPNVMKVLWTKFTAAAPATGLVSAARAAIHDLLQSNEARNTLLAAMREVEAVARAKGVDLAPDVVDRVLQAFDRLPADYRVSMHTDLELGKPLELDALSGAVVRIGEQVGVPTPVNRLLYSLLVIHKDGAPQHT